MNEELINFIRRGFSINKISMQLGIPKSTVYYHYRKIRGRKYSLLNFETKATEKEGEIVGIFVGDGSQYFEPRYYHYEVNVHFGKKNINYAFYVKNLYENHFGKKFELKQEKNTVRLKTSSKDIFNYFKNYLDYNPQLKHSTVKLKTLGFPRKFKIGFLRGLFDTDGSVLKVKKEKRIRVSFCTTSLDLAEQVKKLLNELGIKYGFYISIRKPNKDLYSIQLLKKSTDKFLNTISPFKLSLLRGW